MGMRMKTLISLLLTLFLALLSLAGCQQGDDPKETTATPPQQQETTTDGTQETQNPVAAKYETVAFTNFVNQGRYLVSRWTWEQNVFFIHTAEDLEPFGLEDTIQYSEDLFSDRSLILMRFVHGVSEELVELTGLAIKDGTLCPVLTMTPPGPGENAATLIEETFLTVEVEKSALESYTPGEILIINTQDPTKGNSWHNKFE